MGCLTIVNCLVFLSFFLYFVVAAESFDDRRTKEASPMWFGPRIGRKKRDPSSEKFYRNEKDQRTGIMDVLRESPLVVVAVNEGKQHNFTPRLGRESGEEVTLFLQDDGDLDDSLRPRAINPFAPRLGRTLSPFTPRMGRTNEELLKYS